MTAVDAVSLRVVVADDSSESRALLRAMLDTVDGVDVVGAAADGAQAVDLVARQHPDLVLLDIAMPVMDGLEAAAAIRASDPDTKIAMYSAYNRARMRPAALAAGADEYVEKAATTGELLAQIQRLFPDRPVLAARAPGRARPSASGAPIHTAGEQRYRLLLDALEEGVLTTDSAGLVTDANFIATRILDTPVRRLLGRPLRDVGLDGASSRAVEEALRTGRPVSGIDYTFTRPDGERRDLLVSVRPLHDPASLRVHEDIVSFIDLTEQKTSERRLAAADARMRRSFEAMLDCLVILSAVRADDTTITDFRYQEVNAAACRLTEMTREQLIGHLLCEVLPTHRSNGLFEDYVRVVETGQPLQKHATTYPDVFGSGRRLTLALDIQAVATGDELVVSFRDVTDATRARDDLQRAEQHLQTAIASMNEAFFLTCARRDASGMITDLEYVTVNAEACRIAGRPAEELVGHGLLELYPTHGPTGLFDRYRAVVETGEPYHDVFDYDVEGVHGTFDVTVTRAGDGYVMIGSDITERQRNERELAHTIDLLSRTQEISRTGGWEYDLADRRLAWTDEVYRIYGIDTDHDPNDIPAAVAAYDTASAPVIDAAFQRLLTDGVPYDLELGLDRADGQHIWVRTIGRPIFTDGQLVKVEGNIVDITDRKRAEQELTRLTEVLNISQELSRTGGWDFDVATGAQLLTDEVYRIYGLDPADGPPSLDAAINAYDPDSLPVVQGAWRRAVEQGQPYEIEVRLIRSDGRPVWVRTAGRPVLANGHVARVQGTIADITEEHRVQEQLRRSEELFRGGFDHSPIGMVLKNLDGTFARVNASFASMLGFDDPSELTGVDFASVTHPEDEAGEREGIRRMLAGEPYQAEKRYLRRDGATMHVILSSTAVRDDAGAPIVFFTQVEDITDRKSAELALADSEHRLRAAFEAVNDGLVVLSPVRVDGEIVDFRFDYINDAGCRLNGMPRERHIGNLISDVLPGFRESGLFDDVVQVIQTGEPVHRQSFFSADVFDGGAPVPRVWDVSLANMGDAVINTYRDVTDRVAAETQVRQAEELLQSAVASMTDGFFLTRARRDEDDTITDLEYVLVNDAGYRLTGKAPQDLIGHGYVEVWPTAAYFDECCTVVDTGVPFTTVVETQPPAATSTVRVSVTKAGDGCVFLLTDLSERVQHERQLAAAHSQARARAEQLERANRDLEAFASALSHDLREPLRTTAGFVQLITDQYAPDLPDPARALFGYVTAGTERMNERITAILGFARSGASAAPPHPIDSADAAAAAARDCQAALTDAAATLDLGPLPVVAADALQLQRVFQNLISNAAKYTRPGITPHIAISADRLDDLWQFTVADNGPGVVPESHRERIFAIFVRGGTDDTHDGNGMGLALCRRIIESYGGHIWVGPNPTGGSLFRFTLPTSAEGAALTGSTTNPAAPQRGGSRIAAEAMRALFLNSRDGVLYTAPDGRVFAANPAMCAMFRCSEEEICAAGRDRFVDPDDPTVLAALQERRRTGHFHGELTYRRADGTTFAAESTSEVFLDATGEQRTCTIVRDITARAAEDRALRERTTELAQALDRITEQTEATRRAAIDINDDIVQGLVAAETALDLGRNDEARQFVGRTSRAARNWISHQLRAGGPPTPGSLKRQHPDTSPGSAADQ